jgi:hypothetical protein
MRGQQHQRTATKARVQQTETCAALAKASCTIVCLGCKDILRV